MVRQYKCYGAIESGKVMCLFGYEEVDVLTIIAFLISYFHGLT